MNILLLSPLPPPSGGIARWTERYLAWADGKINASVVNTALIGKRAGEACAKKRIFDEVRRTARIVRETGVQLKNKPDIMHLNTSCSKLGIIRDWLCARKAAKAHVAIAVHCHCNIEDQLGGGKIAVYLFHRIVRMAKAVLVLNEKSQKYIAAIAPEKVKICPNFVLAEQIADAHSIREELRTIVYVGDVRFSKGSDDIYKVAKKLPSKQFIMVGSVAEEMKAQEKPDNVVLLGRLEAAEVYEQLQEADVFLFPSLTEGFSVALLEAMAKGLPCVATDVGANAEMLIEGGEVVDVHDVDGMVRGIESMENKAVRQKMSEANIKKVQTCYEHNKVMEQLIRIYEGIL